ncbi:hypothetical protein SARC_07122 [Sphaeroforma arctica JP610]|uniref:Uncharacterized protein n=1 Tax=Sphaeroforma arctica JP610 TaxID=667725 RepID=A0A0L0FVC9_9EUKA|nr:hypothetical protein SARC_07122 [Sphaeroforma arctica JP610]KNC80516.1 hypothetical protein SARC_07122 [Sphaeroforma arctica JP610]|eukprot:XP_014154418.1 hypothetical protein SARC_07122 [Sphaeroforma arctica JP610]
MSIASKQADERTPPGRWTKGLAVFYKECIMRRRHHNWHIRQNKLCGISNRILTTVDTLAISWRPVLPVLTLGTSHGYAFHLQSSSVVNYPAQQSFQVHDNTYLRGSSPIVPTSVVRIGSAPCNAAEWVSAEYEIPRRTRLSVIIRSRNEDGGKPMPHQTKDEFGMRWLAWIGSIIVGTNKRDD